MGKRDLKLSRVLKRLSKFDVVIIDDIGYVQQSRDEMEVLFTLLAESRHWSHVTADRPRSAALRGHSPLPHNV